jgi:hypothetical protein
MPLTIGIETYDLLQAAYVLPLGEVLSLSHTHNTKRKVAEIKLHFFFHYFPLKKKQANWTTFMVV